MSGMDRNRSKFSQKHVFHFNFCESRLLTPFPFGKQVHRMGQQAMEAEFWIAQFNQVTVYVHLVKYDLFFLRV